MKFENVKFENIQDERVVSQRREIQSDAYSILTYTLLISVVVQQFFLHAPFAQFAVEFFCVIGMGIYLTIRYVSIGYDPKKLNSKSIKNQLFNSLTSGVITVVFLLVLAGMKDPVTIGWIFIISTLTSFAGNLWLQNILKRKQLKIDNELNKAE